LTRRYAREAPDVLNLAKAQIEQFKKTHAGPQPAELKVLEASLKAKASEMEVRAAADAADGGNPRAAARRAV
jgi:hypothetical protein